MKSLYTKLNEALEKMTSKQRDKFFESRKNGSAVEIQLNCAEAILTGKVKESAPIVKHNGRVDNFNERDPFQRVDGQYRPTESNTVKEVCSKGDKIMFDAWLKAGTITEAQHYKLTTGKPYGYEQLSEAQRKEFNSARLIGISEADAFRVAKMTGNTFKEVSHR